MKLELDDLKIALRSHSNGSHYIGLIDDLKLTLVHGEAMRFIFKTPLDSFIDEEMVNGEYAISISQEWKYSLMKDPTLELRIKPR